jgi:hypothetical protein
MPEVSFRDQRANAIAVRSIGVALKDGITNGFMEREEAARVFRRYLGLTGIDADRDEPKEKRGQHDDNMSFKNLYQTATENSSSNGYSYFPVIDSVKQ